MNPPTPAPGGDDPLGPTPLRLDGRQWIAVLAIAGAILTFTPVLWNRAEKFETPPTYRVPYALSEDYALYERHLGRAAADPEAIFVIGDSVVWGEYVGSDGTLSRFLTGETGGSPPFVNAGINGLFPLALEGLAAHYAAPVRGRKVVLHANLLWTSSPAADLSTSKEQVFNHASLVPQFVVDIPCYRAGASDRAAVVARRTLPHLRWVRHLQVCYWKGASLPEWTLADDGQFPPAYPNAYANPAAGFAGGVPTEPRPDPERGTSSPRHRPWHEAGRQPQRFDWVPLERSLQWQAFLRLVSVLRGRDNDVLVVVGPFNEHMIAEASRPGFHAAVQHARESLERTGAAVVVPPVLPSELYGDASHPLTEGYRRLASELMALPGFRDWVDHPFPGSSSPAGAARVQPGASND